jgi:hypothetical protein
MADENNYSNETIVLGKLEKIDEKLHIMDKTLVKQEENLKQHMYRTTLAEKRLEHIENDLKPVKKHIARVDGVLKFLGIAAIVISIVSGILKLLGAV